MSRIPCYQTIKCSRLKTASMLIQTLSIIVGYSHSTLHLAEAVRINLIVQRSCNSNRHISSEFSC